MAHSNTVLAQMLKLLPRHEFDALAREHHEGRKLRKISRWAQFVAMASAQLTGRASLRDLLGNLAAQSSKLYHLGVGSGTWPAAWTPSSPAAHAQRHVIQRRSRRVSKRSSASDERKSDLKAVTA